LLLGKQQVSSSSNLHHF